MKKITLLFLVATITLLAQRGPIPPLPPMTLDLPDLPPLPDLEFQIARLQDLEFQFDDARLAKLGRLNDQISAKVSAKVADAMRDRSARWPFAMAPHAIFHGRTTDHERSYEAGLRALDGRHYERALEAFSQAAMTTGPRTDGALFRKADVLYRLARRDEALSALAELRKSHPSSRWLGDAQALEAEIKKTSGQAPALSDAEDFKVAALSGLIQTDPERAAPIVEQILKGSPYRKLQELALRAIANSESQRNRDLLAQIARGKTGNPDLQLGAIRYLESRRTDNRQLLREIYASATDEEVKRTALRALSASGDTEQLLHIVKSDKDASRRIEALSMLGDSVSPADLWTLYQAETSLEVKEGIVQRLKDLGATERVLDVAKTEKEPNLRQYAMRALGSVTTGDALVGLYATETDQAVKRTIVDALYSHRNAKALVDLARKENDPQIEREIVSRLSRMRSKEALDYLAEKLK